MMTSFMVHPGTNCFCHFSGDRFCWQRDRFLNLALPWGALWCKKKGNRFLQHPMDKTKELSPASIEEKRLLSRAFEAFNSSIEKLRAYQLKLEEQIRELKHELEVKNQELTNILQSLPSGLIVTDLAGRILNFNRSAGAITGIERDAAMGAEINALMGHAVLPHPLDDEALSLISNGYGQHFKITKDADTRTLETDTTLTVSEDGQRLGIIINLSDTTLIDRLKEEAER